MNKIKIGMFYLAVLFLSVSCIETLEIDTKTVQPKIVMNGILEPDSIIKIKVSKSYNLEYTDTLDANRPLPQALIKDAILTLYVNDENLGPMTEAGVDGTRYHTGTFFRSKYHPKIGDKIRIEASATGLKSVWAETQIPKPIIINKIDTTTYYFKNDYHINGFYDYAENTYHSQGFNLKIPEDAKSINMRLKIDIENDNSINNYYAMSIYQKVKETYNEFYFQTHLDLTNEPLFNNSAKNAIYAFFLEEGDSEYNAMIFDDNLFNNGKYTINLSLWGYYFYKLKSYYGDETGDVVYNAPIEIYFDSLSKELYNYVLASKNSSYDEIPFIFEKNTTYTNVHNGIGIVGSRAIAKTTINIPPYKGKIDSKND